MRALFLLASGDLTHDRGDLRAPRLFRHPAVGQPHARKLPRRAPPLGRDAGRGHPGRSTASSICTPSPSGRIPPRSSGRRARWRRPSSPSASTPRAPSSSTRARFRSTPSSPGSSTASPGIGWMNRMTQFKDKAGKNAGEFLARPLRLPGSDGRRHPALPRHPRSRGRGPEAARRADPRHRREVQPRLRRGLLPDAPSR